MEIITLNKPKEEEKEEQNAHKKTTVKEAKVFTIKNGRKIYKKHPTFSARGGVWE